MNMVNFVKTISSEINSVSQRVVKYLRYGKFDVQTSVQVAPFGIDSNPLKDMIAIYSQSMVKGETVVIGYVNKNQLAGIGETRLFSEDSDGVLATYLHLKNNGIIEIGGNTDFMVRYSALETAFNELQDKFNTFANAYIAGSPTVTGMPVAVSPSNADISGAKIDEIKTL